MRGTRSVVLVIALAVVAGAGACKSNSDADEDAAVDAEVEAQSKADAGAEVTYHRHIRPVLEANCVSCHVEGGIAPFALDSWDTVEPYAELAVNAVAAGTMPPWPAADDCHPLADVRRLDDDTIELFEAWQEAEFPVGDKDDYQEPEQVVGPQLGKPDIKMNSGEPYVPDTTVSDEYRCFLMEDHFEEDTFITAIDILPGVREQVHHVQIHTFPEGSLPTAMANDEDSEGPGYVCFGGVQVPGAYNLFSWRPGSLPVSFPEDEAVLVEAGSHVVIQVHYNNQWLTDDPEPDLTDIAFWTMPEGELPKRLIRRSMALAFNLQIPAGEEEVTARADNPMTRISGVGGSFLKGEIIGITPHMHNLGSRFRVNMRREGEDDACLIKVKDWDFEWQFDYMFPEDATISVKDTDVIDLRCTFDNTPENQPVLNGERLQPRDVTWGEGSLDEMCLAYVWLRYDREAYMDRK